MDIRHRHMRKRDPEDVRSVDHDAAFAAIDPGEHGAAVLMDACSNWTLNCRGGPDGIVPLCGGANALYLADCCVELGVHVLVVEEQFRGPDARALIRLARSAGMVIGAVGYASQHLEAVVGGRGPSLTVIWVPPQTWQWPVLELKRPTKSPQIKQLAAEIAARDLDGRYTRARPDDQEGIADAWCIARWWIAHSPR